jgi:hypothetical protein
MKTLGARNAFLTYGGITAPSGAHWRGMHLPAAMSPHRNGAFARVFRINFLLLNSDGQCQTMMFALHAFQQRQIGEKERAVPSRLQRPV